MLQNIFEKNTQHGKKYFHFGRRYNIFFQVIINNEDG